MIKTKNKKNSIRNFWFPSLIVFGVFALSLFSIFTLPSRAASQISLTSVLSDTEGRLVSEGSYAVRFAIYSNDRTDTNAALGSPLWQEIQTLSVANGRVRTFLGATNELPRNLDFRNNEYYLGIQVGDDSEMVPRKRVTSVVNALHAENATEASSLLGKVLGDQADNIPTLGKGGKMLVSMLPIGTGAKQLITGSDSRLHDQNTDTGTDSKIFTIGSGTASSSANFDLAVSSDTSKPALRYNGSLGQWQYSDNGTLFKSFVSAGGVSSLVGTSDQVIVSGSTGDITLSLSQSISTTSTPVFAGLTTSSGGNIFVGGGISTFDSSVADGYAEFSGICLGNGTSCITDWSAAGGIDGSGSTGHIAFWNDANTLTFDNGNLYWDSANNRLGIGTASPSSTLSIEGDTTINGALYATSLTINGQASLGVLGQNVTLNSSMVPSSGGLNLGSATNHWANIYADNISVGAMNVSGTTAEYFTINTDATLDEPAGLRFYKGSVANGYAALDWMDGASQSFVLYSKESDSTLAGLHTGDLTVNTNDLVVTGGKVGIGDATPASLFTVGSGDTFQVDSSGIIVSAAGITSSGTITFSGLTPSRMVFSGSTSELTSSAVSSVVAASLTDETGTGSLVFSNSPSFTTPTLGAASATSLTLSSALGVQYGGTGSTSFAVNGILYGNGTSGVDSTAPGTSGQLVVADSIGIPAFVSVIGDASLIADGTLTIGTGAINSGKIADGTVLAIDLSQTNGAANGYMLSYDSASGGFTWLSPGAVGAGDITDIGSCASGACFVDGTNNTLTFEGSTGDANEITLSAADPTADRNILLPNADGTIALLDGAQTFTSATWQGSTIAVAYGGTGATTLTSNGVLYGNGTSAVQSTSAGTSGQLLVANASNIPTFVSLSGDATLAASGAFTIGTGAITSGKILDGAIAGVDIQATNGPTDGYIMAYDNASGGFTWIPNSGGSGASKWTDNNLYTYLTDSTDDLLIGGTNPDEGFYFDVSASTLTFEGATANVYETMLTVVDPTADRTITFPNVSGTVITSGNLSSITSVGTVTSGTWNGSAIGAGYGGTGIDTSASTGVATVSSGTWSITSSLSVAYGGTGATTLTSNGVLYGNGTSAVGVTSAGTEAQFLVANASNIPTFVSLSGDATLAASGAFTIGTGAITGSKILDATIQEEDLNVTNSLTPGYILSVNSDGTFSWISNSGGSGASKWTDAGAYTYLTDTSDSVVIGGSATDTGFYFNTASSTLTFEGVTANAFETTFAVVDSTADRTITFPDITGTVALLDGGQTFTSATWNGSAIGAAYGGTGQTSLASNGQLLIGNGSGYTLATLTQGSGISITNASGSITLASTLGTSVDLTSEVTGTLPVANGGTGAATFTANGVLYGNGTSALGVTAAGTAGQALISGGASAPSWYAPTAGSILFAGTSGVLSQDNTNLFWDDNNNWLGIGTSTPASPLQISGTNNAIRLSYDATHYATFSASSTGNITTSVYGATDAALAIGNGTDQATSVRFDRSTQDYYLGVDNSDHIFKIGAGLSVGTTPYLSINTTGNVGIGDTSPASLLTVGSGDVFQVNSSGDIVKIKGLTYSWPASHATSGVLTNNGSGTLTWATLTGSSITADTLDFTEFADTMALDANLTLNQSTNTWTQNFTGTTTTGLTYNANSLTTGTAMSIASTSTAGGTSGSSYLLNLAKSGSNANASHTAYGISSTVTNVGTTSTNIAGYFSASGGTNNYGLLVAAGYVGIGTTTPAVPLHVYGSSNALRLAYDASNYISLSSSSSGSLSIISGGSTDTTLIVGDNTNKNTSIQFDRSTQDYYLGVDNSDHIFKIGAGLTVGTTPYLSINTTGNVGIGDASPVALLTVGSGDVFQVNSSGAIAAATGITSSGTINFSGLTASRMVFTDASKNLSSSATSSVIASSLSDETGSGSVVFSNSPSFTTPVLGAASATSLTLSSALGAQYGGTGLSSYTIGDIVYASGTTALSALPDVATGNVLISGGVGTAPSWGKVTGSHLNADTLDFTEFADTMALDANLTLNQSTNTWTQNFTGTTTTGLTYNANSLTTGTAMSIASTSTAGGTSGSSYLLNLAKSGSNANASHTAYGISSTVTNVGTTSTNIAGYFSASGGTNNYGLLVAAGYVGIGTTTPTTQLELYSSASADEVFTLTSATSSYDPLIKFRTGASPSIQFTMGIDNSDSGKFKIYSGDGLGSGDEFVIDSNGTTTIANLNLGAQSFDSDAGIVSWIDMPVTSSASNGTEESYTAQIDGNSFLKFYATSDGAGSINSSASAVISYMQLDATTDGLQTKVNAGACSDSTFNRDANGTLCIDSTNGRLYFRYGGAWHYAAQTAGFQIPDYEAYSYNFNKKEFDTDKPLVSGDFLMPFVETSLEDGALHGLYAKFSDVKDNLLKDEHDQISALTLKTDQSVTTLAGLQTSVDQQLLTISGNLSDIAKKDDKQDKDIAALTDDLSGQASAIASLQTDLSTQTTLTSTLQTQLATLQTEVQTLMDFYSTLQLGNVVTADASGNVDLLGGKLRVAEVTASGVSIEVTDPDAPTIGTAILYPVAKDANNDGNDDFTGKPMNDPSVIARDGKSIEVKTKAVVAKSHVFVTQREALDQPLAVTDMKTGSSFTVSLKSVITDPVSFDWWIVEEK